MGLTLNCKGNKVEKLKRFFGEGSLKALNIFGQFLMRAIEFGQQTVETRRNEAHQKWGKRENGVVYFEIGGIGTSKHFCIGRERKDHPDDNEKHFLSKTNVVL